MVSNSKIWFFKYKDSQTILESIVSKSLDRLGTLALLSGPGEAETPLPLFLSISLHSEGSINSKAIASSHHVEVERAGE